MQRVLGHFVHNGRSWAWPGDWRCIALVEGGSAAERAQRKKERTAGRQENYRRRKRERERERERKETGEREQDKSEARSGPVLASDVFHRNQPKMTPYATRGHADESKTTRLCPSVSYSRVRGTVRPRTRMTFCPCYWLVWSGYVCDNVVAHTVVNAYTHAHTHTHTHTHLHIHMHAYIHICIYKRELAAAQEREQDLAAEAATAAAAEDAAAAAWVNAPLGLF